MNHQPSLPENPHPNVALSGNFQEMGDAQSIAALVFRAQGNLKFEASLNALLTRAGAPAVIEALKQEYAGGMESHLNDLIRRALEQLTKREVAGAAEALQHCNNIREAPDVDAECESG